VNLFVVGIGKAFAQAMKEEFFSEFGKLDGFGKTLSGGHSAEGLDVEGAVGFGLQVHLVALYG
jgi:hypothetical protein